MNLKNSVVRQTLILECDNEEQALALRSSLGDYNKAHLLPVIERVLLEAAPAGRHVCIERLEIDLGTMEPDEFEDVAPQRLYVELKEALERALSSPLLSRTQSEEVRKAEILERYLLRGTLDASAPAAASFSLDDWLNEMASQDPQGLARLIRRAGLNEYALARLVNQSTDAALRRIVAVLDPEHAALIFSYLADLHGIHREEPVAAVNEAEFDRMLWLVTLSYLVRDAGSQFNRKVFLQSLIRGVAAQYGMDYEQMLALFAAALEHVTRRHGLPSSLPAVLSELVRESPASDLNLESSNSNIDKEPPSRELEIEELARLVRLKGRDAAWLEMLVRGLDHEVLVRLIGVLDPDQAGAIVPFLFSVRDAQRAAPVLADHPSDFHQFLWSLALAYIVAEPGSEFNRKAFLLSLLRRLAQAVGVDLASVLGSFRTGLDRLASKAPVKSSLPAIFSGLLNDCSNSAAGADPLPAWPASNRDPVLAGVRNSSGSGTPTDPGIASPASDRAPAAPSAPDPLHSALAPHPHDDPGRHARVVLAAIQDMPPHQLRRVLADVLPAINASGPLAEALRSTLDKPCPREFHARLISAALRGEPLDFDNPEGQTPAGQAPLLPESMDPRELKAAIAARLSAGPAAAPGLHSAYSLIAILLRRDATDARRLLRSVIGNPEYRETLFRTGDSTEFETILELVAGANARPVLALLRHVQGLAASDRPPLDHIRAVLLSETLLREPGREMDADFFERLLAALFPAPLSQRVRESLLSSASTDAQTVRAVLDPPHGASRTQAINAAAKLTDLLSRLEDGEPAAHEIAICDFDEMLRHASEETRRALRDLLNAARVRRQIARILPDSLFLDVLRLLNPVQARTLADITGILASAWASTHQSSGPEAAQHIIRTAILDAIAAGSSSCEALAHSVIQSVRRSAAGEEAVAAFLRNADSLAEKGGAKDLRAALTNAAARRDHEKPAPRRRVFTKVPADAPVEDVLYVENAGLVLASPFLPHFFSSLNFLKKSEKRASRWRNDHVASRAVHLLQYLVDERGSAPEPLLILNKILCGLPVAQPIEKQIAITEEEKEVCDRLMRALIANWQVVSGSSPAAVRETFFQRAGKLQREADQWKLHVQRKTLDVLVDQAPWSFSLVVHDWMPEPLHVSW